MEQILDTLIQVTKQLNEGAKHAIPEKELELLQQKQAEILEKASFVDHQIKKKDSFSKEILEKRERILEKITEFQSMNQEFISHVSDHKRIIQKKELSPEIRKMILENNVESH